MSTPCEHRRLTMVRLSLEGSPLTGRGPYVVCQDCAGLRLPEGTALARRDPPDISDHTFNPVLEGLVYPQGSGMYLLDRVGALTHPAVRS